MNLHNSELPNRDYNQIKQTLLESGFDPEIRVTIWQKEEDKWRWTAKTSLGMAIWIYEWHKANKGKTFPPHFLYETKIQYIFGLNSDVNEEVSSECGLSVQVCS